MTELPVDVQRFVGESPIYRRPIAAAVAKLARDTPAGTTVLDAGSGSAPYRPLFAHCDYVTQDWSASPHAEARQADIIADLAELPVPDERFGVIVCTEVLEHVSDPARVMTELFRVTKRGGKVLLTVPFVIELHEEPYDFFRYTSHALQHLLETAGFDEVTVTPLSGWFSTILAMMRNAHGTLGSPGWKGLLSRFAGVLLWGISEALRRAAPKLDDLDDKRLLPSGWAATARRPS